MINKRNDAMFITVEGIDGAGKTTVLDHIYKMLMERKMLNTCTREPGGSKLNEEFRRALLYNRIEPLSTVNETLFMLSCRKHHLDHLILPYMSEGLSVVCSRFNDSTYVYQGHVGGKLDFLRSLSAISEMKFMRERPDLTVFLTAEASVANDRVAARGAMDALDEKFNAQAPEVEEAWHNHIYQITQHNRDVWSGKRQIIVIDANQPLDVVQQCLDSEVTKAIDKHLARPDHHRSYIETMG